MDRIQKVSCYILMAFKLLIVALPILIVAQWLFIDVEPIKNLVASGALLSPVQAPEGMVNLGQMAWSPLSKLLGCAAQLMASLPLFLSLFALQAIFKNYKSGEIFSVDNARHYRYCGWLFFLDAIVAQPLSNMLQIAAVTINNPPGHRYIAAGFGTPNLQAIFCGILLIVISWVMLEASNTYQEQKFTI